MSNAKEMYIDERINYKVDKKAGAVAAYATVSVADWGFLTGVSAMLVPEDVTINLVGVARLKEGDEFNEEVGKRIARLKLIRKLNKVQYGLIESLRDVYRQEIKNLDKVSLHKARVIDNLDDYIHRECREPYTK